MNLQQLYDIHEFMKSHEFDESDVRNFRVCKHCKMLFFSWYNNTPIIKLSPDTYSADQIVPFIPKDILQYDIEKVNPINRIWWAVQSKDPDGSIIDGILKSTDDPRARAAAIIIYAKHVKRIEEMDKAMTFPQVGVHEKINYCKAINKPLASIRATLTQKHDKRFFFQSVEKPYWDEQVKKNATAKTCLWSRMKPYWNNTTKFNSPEYKELEKKHLYYVNKEKCLVKIRTSFRDWSLR